MGEQAEPAVVQHGEAVRLTDHWGEPFTAPEWRRTLSERMEMPACGTWPAAGALTQD